MYSKHTKENISKAHISSRNSEVLEDNDCHSDLIKSKNQGDEPNIIMFEDLICMSSRENTYRRFSKPVKKTGSFDVNVF